MIDFIKDADCTKETPVKLGVPDAPIYGKGIKLKPRVDGRTDSEHFKKIYLPELFPLEEYDLIVVLISGGKDSVACYLKLLELGVPKERIEFWHHDIDGGHPSRRMDWKCTQNYVKALADAEGIKLRVSYRVNGFFGELYRIGASEPIEWIDPDTGEVKQCKLSSNYLKCKYERLWSQVQLLGWNITKKAFWSSYVQTEWVENGDGYKNEVITGYKHTKHLKKKLADHGCIFMKTADVIELPEQTEQKIFFKVTQAYKYFIKNSYIMLDTLNMCKFKDDSDYYGTDVTPRVELVGDNSLTKMLYARQLCGQWHKEKLEGLRDLVESTEDRLIIFYNFTAELEAMQKKLADLNRPYSVVNGSKKDLTAYDQADDSITFIQYQAGAMGGNYQKANKIIYFTLPLGKGSCDMWEQSKKRMVNLLLGFALN